MGQIRSTTFRENQTYNNMIQHVYERLEYVGYMRGMGSQLLRRVFIPRSLVFFWMEIEGSVRAHLIESLG